MSLNLGFQQTLMKKGWNHENKDLHFMDSLGHAGHVATIIGSMLWLSFATSSCGSCWLKRIQYINRICWYYIIYIYLYIYVCTLVQFWSIRIWNYSLHSSGCDAPDCSDIEICNSVVCSNSSCRNFSNSFQLWVGWDPDLLLVNSQFLRDIPRFF